MLRSIAAVASGCAVAAACGGGGAGGEGESGTDESTSTSTTTITSATATTTSSMTTSTMTSSSSSGADGSTGAAECVAATLLWAEDFETGDYSRWTSMTYDDGWNGGVCESNGFSSDAFVSEGNSHRSEITCVGDMDVHRGYGGLQFDGDAVVPAYTNMGVGIEAPYGVVNTFWSRLDVPYAFGDGKWFSFWTVNDSCDWTSNVLTLGLEDASNRLTPAHVLSTGGTVEFDPAAPGFPIGTFARVTIFVDYYAGVLHVWQDGQSVVHATFTRETTDLCQWHWGAYASGDNDDLVLFEDDNSIWKLEEPWTDFSVEPWLGEDVTVCN